MAGLYLHIPFCKQACHYCNFHFSTTYDKYRDRMISALCKQIINDSSILKKRIDTIYFGGGTPSLLSAKELESLLSTIKSNFSLSEDVEITIEANPDDITHKKSMTWKTIGINRVSIGVQSFFQENLATLNRAHNNTEAINSINIVKNVGFKNYSVDLMFSLPDLTNEMWAQNLDKVIALKVPHISCYNLTIEERTALSDMISKNKLPALSENTASEQFILTMDKLNEAGYSQYEISNYCLNGMESKHNRAYWQQKEYLGIGPGSHSYVNERRESIVANNMQYIRAIENNSFSKEHEDLSPENKYNEFVLTNLRTSEGIDHNKLILHHKDFVNHFRKALVKHVGSGTVIRNGDYIVLTTAGKLIADQVAMDMFV